MHGYVDRALRYARSVVAGEIEACKWARLACERQLRDLDRAERDPAWPYVFDRDRAERPCLLIECLPHIKGRWKTSTIHLEDWQCFIETTVFGWVRRDTGARRFRTAYTEVPRKNAKSTLTSGNAIYMLACDGEAGAEVYSAATTGDQARIVFDVSKAMLRRDPRIAEQFGVGVGEHAIFVHELASTFKPLNAEGSTLDGLNVHFASVDELHAHKRRDVWDVLATATGSRAQPLLWAITTAGSDRAGICYEQRDYVLKLLENVVEDDSYFGIVYTIDDGDDWTDERVWAKANPNLGVSVSLDDLRAKARFAMQMPSAQSNFLTKHLNVWVNADTSWMDMRSWEACADRTLRLEDFAGQECFIGMDLAEKHDFAALVLAFERDGKVVVFPRFYLNEHAVETGANSQYDGWARAGHIQVNDGNATDFDGIADDLRRYCQMFKVREIPFDPALSRYFATKLVEEGLPLVEVRQAPLFFTQPLIQIANLVLEGKLRFDGNPVLTWMVSNVAVRTSRITQLQHPVKTREENKIDGAVAMFLALGRMITPAEPAPKYQILFV
jgi:phage terminase large subunit-like protein